MRPATNLEATPHRGEIDAGEAGGPDGALRFFFDGELIELLQQEVFPAIIEQKTAGDTLRIWVPNCETGEEAYSLAIVVQECLARSNKLLELKLFATDPEPESVHTARAGLYPAVIAGQLPAGSLASFFVEEGGGYRIQNDLRSRC